MCLGVPGRVTRIETNSMGMTVGRVEFGGMFKDVSLAYVPEVQIGDYVIVHVGFALSKIDEAAASEIYSFLKMNDDLAELETPQENGIG
jgi:hydrogenase expression/formation protein HypC